MFRQDALSVQAQVKVVADGNLKSPVAGVSRHGDRWQVQTLRGWGVKHRHLGVASAREEAELIAATYFPRLKAAAAAGAPIFEEELAAVRAERRVQVRWRISP
jgi:hypothetical protein